MNQVHAVVVLLIGVGACDPRAAPEATSSRSPAAAQAPDLAARPDTPPCDAVRPIVEAALDLRLSSADDGYPELDRDCVLRGRGDAPDGPPEADPEPRVLAALDSAGWKDDPSASADGPSETWRVVRRDADACTLVFLYPDPPEEYAAVAETETRLLPYEIVIGCTASPRPAADGGG
jgi:hypothetical protein